MNRNNYDLYFHNFSKRADNHFVCILPFQFLQGFFPRGWLYIIFEVSSANKAEAVIPCALKMIIL